MKIIKIFTLTCSECSMTQAMQPCEACPNWLYQKQMMNNRDKKYQY